MTSFPEMRTGLRCDHPGCGAEYPAGYKTAGLARQAARGIGWTARRHPKGRVSPRIYDACPRHTVPPEYTVPV